MTKYKEFIKLRRAAHDYVDNEEYEITEDDLWSIIAEIERLRAFEALARETGIFKQ